MDNHPKRLNRRSILTNGAGLLAGGSLLSGFAPSQPQATSAGAHPFYDVRDFGATGKREENSTAPIRAAVDVCAGAGGGTVYVPPGQYTVGTIQLKDNVTLHLEAGATLLLSQSRADFPTSPRTMIFAENAKNISVVGKGTLDGLAQYVFVEMRDLDVEIAEEIEIARKAGIDMRRYYRTGMQTYMFILNNCTNVLLRDVSIVNSPLWTVRLNDCDRVFVQGVYIYSDLEKGVNADGIDIVSSRNVTISDSIIVTADDSIVLKSMPRGNSTTANPVENIVVTNCVLESSSTALMIGTETHADIRHVVFNNCVIRNSNKGFGINVQDGATVSDVVFSNLTIETSRRHWNWWGSAEMCKFVLKKRSASSRLGAIRDIVVDNVIAHVRGTSTMTGCPEKPLENIRMSGIQMFMEPENTKDKRATDAMRIEGVRGLRVRDLAVTWREDQTEAKWQSALVLKKVSDFDIAGFSGRQGLQSSDVPAVIIDQSADGVMHDSSAADGCRRFIHLQGAATKQIVLRNNDVGKAERAVTFEDDTVKKAVELK